MHAPAGCRVFVSTYSPLELFLRVSHRQSTIGRERSNGGDDRRCSRPPPGSQRSLHACAGIVFATIPTTTTRTNRRLGAAVTYSGVGAERRESPWSGRVDHECARLGAHPAVFNRPPIALAACSCFRMSGSEVRTRRIFAFFSF